MKMANNLVGKTEFCIGQKIKCNLEGGVYEGFIKNFEFFGRNINVPVIVIEITKMDPNHDYLNQRELRVFPNYQIKNPRDYNNWIKKLKELDIINSIN